MRPKTLLSFVVTGVLVLAGCGSGSDSPEGTESDDKLEGLSDAEAMAAAAEMAGLEAPANVPVINDRDYKTGMAHAKVTGFFTAEGSVALNEPASLTSGGQTWIMYGDSGSTALSIGVTSNQYDAGATITQGTFTVTAGGTDCESEFDVKPALITGKFKCPGATAYDKSSGNMGKVDLEVTFDASS